MSSFPIGPSEWQLKKQILSTFLCFNILSSASESGFWLPNMFNSSVTAVSAFIDVGLKSNRFRTWRDVPRLKAIYA